MLGPYIQARHAYTAPLHIKLQKAVLRKEHILVGMALVYHHKFEVGQYPGELGVQG